MGYEEAKEKTLEICLYKMGYGGKSSEKTGPNLLKNGMLETCQVPKVGLLELSNPVLIHSTMNVPGVCQPPYYCIAPLKQCVHSSSVCVRDTII